MAVSISIEIKQNQRLIASNESDVTVTVTAKWSGGSYNTLQKSGWLKIDGVKYDFTSSFNTGRTTSGSQILFSETVDVTHKSDGTKTLSCSASYTSGVSSGTVTASASKALVAIPRKSTLSASNGSLGTEQTLTVTRQSASFTHTITYTCGEISGTVCTKSSSESISFTPPLSLISQNTTGKSVSVKFTITTYNGTDSLGSSTKTITCSVSDDNFDSLKPSVSITVAEADSKTYLTTYGGYIQNKSKLTITISDTPKQSATIKSRKTTIDGKTYTGKSFTTDVISSSGQLTIETTVTDSRGYTNSTSSIIKVLEYSPPKFTALSVYRSNSNYTENPIGEYLTIKFSASFSSLKKEELVNGKNVLVEKNKAEFKIKYRKNGTTGYNETPAVPLDSFTATDIKNALKAEKDSSYDFVIELIDNFGSIESSSTGQTATKAWSIFHKGLGFAFGKIAEIKNALDVAWNLIARKNIYMGYYHDDEKNIFFKNNAAHTNKSVDTTNKVYPHNCKVYGGSASSPTAIGFYDTRNNKAVYVYRDYDNYVITQTNIRQHIIEARPADSSTITLSSTAWSDVPLKTATMDNGLNPTLDNNSGADRFFLINTNGEIECNCKGYVMVSAQVYLTQLTASDTVGVATYKKGSSSTSTAVHQAVFYTKSDGSATDIQVPVRVFPVAAGDKIGIQARNATAARGTVDKNATRTRLVVQYVG